MEHHKISHTNVSRETFKETQKTYLKYKKPLEVYTDRLLWWNKRVNLVSRDVPRETINNHILHSLLIRHVEAYKSANTIIDAGTGGGLPGIPLAITHPHKRFILNDIVSKKCLAIKQIARKLDLGNIEIVDSTIETIQQNTPFLLISKHAFKINDLYHKTSHLPWKTMVLYKGTDFQTELEGIQDPLTIDCYDLSNGGQFYQGKALISIHRN